MSWGHATTPRRLFVGQSTAGETSLTSAGVKNASIRNALLDLLGKPIEESTALCIPTAQYGHPHLGPV